MRQLRVWLALWASKAWLWTVIALVPGYPAPGRARWAVKLDPQPDTVVTLLFVPVDKPHKYHIVTHYSWDAEAVPMVVDGGTRSHLHPVSTELTVERLAKCYGAAYVVQVFTREVYDPENKTPKPAGIGPYSCATLGKQLIGYNDPTILTPEQLLYFLWRSRYGA